MPELSFFIGKGGVGKTTVSSAYAVHRAYGGRRVLLLSTDPAHSLADLFQTTLGHQPKRLPLRGGSLYLWQIDAERRFQQFLDKYRDAIFEVVESGTIFTRKEIEPLLSTTLPGMAEVSALLAIADLLQQGRYDELVVDTAPVGHTLRLFQMPEHFLRFLDFLEVAGSRDQLLAATFGGHVRVTRAFLAEWREMVARVWKALSAGSAKLVLVTTPERFALNESVRAAKALAEDASELRVSEIVLNRVVTQKQLQMQMQTKTAEDAEDAEESAKELQKHKWCESCAARSSALRSAKNFLRQAFPRVPLRVGEDHGSPVLGARDLRAFGEHVFSSKKLRLATAPPKIASKRGLRPVSWPLFSTPLSLTLGKGGVGKTTISAGLAFHHRRKRKAETVTICSTDPAPSLDDVFATEVSGTPAPVLGDRKLLALEIDSVAEFRRWADAMRQKVDRALSTEKSGVHVDLSFDRRLFRALLDIVPPGVDELFAVFKILDLLETAENLPLRRGGAEKAVSSFEFQVSGEKSRREQQPQHPGSIKSARVLIDMAPTGHALELLRMPERMLMWSRLLLRALANHRQLPLAQEVGVEIARISQRVRTLAATLKDGKRSRLWPVMLAEPLPDRQTERLLAAIKGLGAHAGPLVVNRVLLSEDAERCPRCSVARRWQLATLQRLAKRRRPFLVVPNFAHEIAGAAALQSLTRQLWQPS